MLFLKNIKTKVANSNLNAHQLFNSVVVITKSILLLKSQ